MKSIRIRSVLKALGFIPMGRGKRRRNYEKLYVNKDSQFAYVYFERDRYSIASKMNREEAREFLFNAGKEQNILYPIKGLF